MAYEKEAQQQRDKVAKMKADERDPYEIKKQEEVLQESVMMIPDCNRRLIVGLEDLRKALVH